MIIKSQCNQKMILDPKMIEEDRDSERGVFVKVDGVIMAYYTNQALLNWEMDRLHQDLIHGVKHFTFKKEKALTEDQPTNLSIANYGG